MLFTLTLEHSTAVVELVALRNTLYSLQTCFIKIMMQIFWVDTL